jgi:hypothetical protein
MPLERFQMVLSFWNHSMERLISNALDLQGELATFIEEQIWQRYDKASLISNTVLAAAAMLQPILNTFKYYIELRESKSLGTLAHVAEMEVLMPNSLLDAFRHLFTRRDRTIRL